MKYPPALQKEIKGYKKLQQLQARQLKKLQARLKKAQDNFNKAEEVLGSCEKLIAEHHRAASANLATFVPNIAQVCADHGLNVGAVLVELNKPTHESIKSAPAANR